MVHALSLILISKSQTKKRARGLQKLKKQTALEITLNQHALAHIIRIPIDYSAINFKNIDNSCIFY